MINIDRRKPFSLVRNTSVPMPKKRIKRSGKTIESIEKDPNGWGILVVGGTMNAIVSTKRNVTKVIGINGVIRLLRNGNRI